MDPIMLQNLLVMIGNAVGLILSKQGETVAANAVLAATAGAIAGKNIDDHMKIIAAFLQAGGYTGVSDIIAAGNDVDIAHKALQGTPETSPASPEATGGMG